MSQVLIQQYLNQLQDLRKVSGTHRELVVREAFKDLLKGWARSHDLIFVPEYEIATPAKDAATSTARWFMLCACLSAIGKPRTKRTISTPRSRSRNAAAIRKTTSSSRIQTERF